MRRALQRMSYRDMGIALLLICGIVWFGHLLIGIAEKEERARQDVALTQGQLASLQARQATLEENLNDLDTARGKEAALRDTLGVARPGEDVIVVVPASATTSATTTKSWWQKVLDWF